MLRYLNKNKSAYPQIFSELGSISFLDFSKRSIAFVKQETSVVFAGPIIKYLTLRNRSFIFNNNRFPFFLHKYNTTWKNERCVEVSIILNLISGNKKKHILEVGAVLPHYTDVSWDVVDMFEKGPTITNTDITSYDPPKKYDLVVSISTLEHVGKDDVLNKTKVTDAINAMKRLLSKDGLIVATIPLGYNNYLDDLIFSDNYHHGETYFLKRLNQKNDWVQVTLSEIKDIKYNSPYPSANGLAVLVFHNH